MITLAHGSGGEEMQELIEELGIKSRGRWKNTDDDAATLELRDGRYAVFTTDSYTVDPIFFPDSDIGHLAFSGTVNDLLMMGAEEISLSLALVIEEGFPKKDLMRIMDTINALSDKHRVPIVTGDTKVMPKGKVDRIIINTAGIGFTQRVLDDQPQEGDRVIISGGIGEHAVALLSKRFDFETSIVSDSRPLTEEFSAVRDMIKAAKDPTRGGLASCLNEICSRYKTGMVIHEDKIPIRQGVMHASEMLGIDPLELACEGRFVCIASKEKAMDVIRELKRFSGSAREIGEVAKGTDTIVKTRLGERLLKRPRGRIVPRIC